MEKFGRKIESVKPILIHAKQNMIATENIRVVKEDVIKMKRYFEDNYN